MATFKMTCLALLIASALIMSVSAHHPPGSPCWDNVDVGVACPAGSQGQSGTRYFHNHDDDKCEPFAYKGCGGNKNNYKTHDECHKECSHEHSTHAHAHKH